MAEKNIHIAASPESQQLAAARSDVSQTVLWVETLELREQFIK
jgi:hypothetical protein